MSDFLTESSELWEIVAKILISAVLGGAVGAERERTGKWAGLRTHMLIAVGSALLTDISILVGLRY
ncbi:MAG TPA: MgtC/SapB family protein, partial [Thermoanaerobaculia bacterium]